MNGLYKVFIVIAVSCAVIGCTAPIGNIGGGSGAGGDGDKLEAIPKKTTYNLTEVFTRDYDLSVFISYRGILHTVPINEVAIYVIEDPTKPETSKVLIPVDPDEDKYMFTFVGNHIGIMVEYNNLSDTYYIEVDDPFDVGGLAGSGSGSGIEVIWGF